MTKAELRKLYISKRKALSEAEYLHLNRQLCENFFMHIDLSFVRVLHCFIPITEKREVDTWLIIDRIRREFQHIRLSIPRVNESTNSLENLYYEGLHQLKKNRWGILEPYQGVPTPVEKIDMVLVPLLAFDKLGNRVGYGKGYYDWFLSFGKTELQKIGLSLFDPENYIPNEPTDVLLTQCITPSVYYQFEKV